MHLIGFTGKPAAGKSFAADRFAQLLGVQMLEMGDVVTERAADHVGVAPDELTSNQKGDAATELREIHGETVFAEATVAEARQAGTSSVVISGVRTPEEISVFEAEADSFSLVLVDAPFDTRYQRFIDRGREDESEYTREDFRSRTERELGWGLDRVLENELYDVVIENAGSVSSLDSALSDLAETR